MKLSFSISRKPKEWTDEDLVLGCQKADRVAQRIVYERYSRRMYAVCLRYVNTNFEAEDLLMTGFMRVFEHISRYESKGSFEGWIRRIMVNEALGYLRKHKNMQLQTGELEAETLTEHATPNEAFQAEELLALVQDLPTGFRTVFNLYAVEGYSHKEIAEMLGITESTSKSQLSRARVLLQQKLTMLEQNYKTR